MSTSKYLYIKTYLQNIYISEKTFQMFNVYMYVCDFISLVSIVSEKKNNKNILQNEV